MRNKLTFTVIITGLILAYFGVETGVLWSKSPHHKHSLKSCYVKVIDGDTISLDGSKIRLQGIDAPESRQICKYKDSKKSWRCGEKATEYLKSLLLNKEVNCSDEGLDKYKRQLSYCFVQGKNINQEMVKAGYAVAYVRYDKSFYFNELIARLSKKGIWDSYFKNPAEWRKQKKSNKHGRAKKNKY